MPGIFFTQDGMISRYAPVNAKAGIKDADAAVGFGVIKVVTFVLEDGFRTQDGKSVGKAAGNEELAVVVFCQFDCHMLAISGTSFADATSSTAPFTQRTSLLWVKGGRWKCSPRMTP